MTAEQKKIALVAVAGGGGLILLLYLLRSGTGTGAGVGAGAGVSPSGQLQIPPGSNIVYNFPGFQQPSAIAATPTPPSCTKLCDQCDDSTAFAGVASYQISQVAIAQMSKSMGAPPALAYGYSLFPAYVSPFTGYGD